MLVVTITSKRSGERISSAATASTISSSTRHPGNPATTFRDLAQEKPVGHAEHIRLVHDGELLPPASRQLAGGAHDPRRGLGRDLAERQGDVGLRHELAAAGEHVAVGVEAFGILADDDEVHRLAQDGQLRPRAAGPDIGIEIELDAELGRRD